MIIVHMAGRSCELNEIVKICKLNKIKLIEDCAHSLGTKYFYKVKFCLSAAFLFILQNKLQQRGKSFDY